MVDKKKGPSLDPYVDFEADLIKALQPYIRKNSFRIDLKEFTATRLRIVREAFYLNTEACKKDMEENIEDDATQRLLDMREQDD